MSVFIAWNYPFSIFSFSWNSPMLSIKQMILKMKENVVSVAYNLPETCLCTCCSELGVSSCLFLQEPLTSMILCHQTP